MNDSTAVIAAGGYGTRCGSVKPKAMLSVGQYTYLELLLKQLQKTSIRDVIICCNRPEYLPQLLPILDVASRARILIDEGVRSTIELAIHAANICNTPNVLFCYGHTPRRAEHLKALLKETGRLAVTVVERTTKRNSVAFPLGGYVEPPYRLPSSSIMRTPARSWSEYFSAQHQEIVGLAIEGPGEFNYETERRAYGDYVASWSSERPDRPVATYRQ